ACVGVPALAHDDQAVTAYGPGLRVRVAGQRAEIVYALGAGPAECAPVACGGDAEADNYRTVPAIPARLRASPSRRDPQPTEACGLAAEGGASRHRANNRQRVTRRGRVSKDELFARHTVPFHVCLAHAARRIPWTGSRQSFLAGNPLPRTT